MKREGFPFARVSSRRVVVDHATRGVRVAFTLDPGPFARFGETRIQGLKKVREPFVRGRLPWKRGEPFNADRLAEGEKELTETNLFGLVRIIPTDSLDADGELPMTLELRELAHRSIRAGASYKTDEGPGGKLSWEHRNLLQSGEKLQLALEASAIGFSFDASFKKPAFLHRDQSLLIHSKLGEEDTDAYKSRYWDSGFSLERKVGKVLKWHLGPGFRWSRVTQLDREEDFALVSFPAKAEWDWSDIYRDHSQEVCPRRCASRASPSATARAPGSSCGD